MSDDFETLKTIAVLALRSLLSAKAGHEHSLKIRVSYCPEIGQNIFLFAFGEPESEDSGDSESPYLALVVEVDKVAENEFDCRVVQTDIINDPKENTLSYRLYLEDFKRKIPRPPEEPPAIED